MRRSLALALTLALWPLGSPARLAAAEPVAEGVLLAVPFLPQTEALCGGAAAAMLFRYWGDRRADVQQFAPLVDRTAGGIATDALVGAIEARGWKTERIAGTVASLEEQLGRAVPVLILLEDRPARYHFVVVVGVNADSVIIHDPTWGPKRRYAPQALIDRWKPSGYWALVVTPPEDRDLRPAAPLSGAQPHPRVSSPSEGALGEIAAPVELGSAVPVECDAAIDLAIASLGAQRLDEADQVLGELAVRCPASPRPLSELAGVRFAQRRFAEADALARSALAIDRRDEYAWNVLASSRFVQHDIDGAVRSWNAVDRPMLDSVALEGLTFTRYAALAQMLPLEPNTLVTARDLALTRRRVHELPGIAGASVTLIPDPDGWAVVRVAVVERPRRPQGLPGWAVAAAQTLVNRELSVEPPGWSGAGEVWSGSWRFWKDRPRLAVSFAAPRVKPTGGVWRVDGSWMAQVYRADPAQSSGSGEIESRAIREERVYGGLVRSNWATPQLRYEVSTGLGAWSGDRKAIGAGLTLDGRLAGDRVVLTGGARAWWGLRGAAAFQSGRAQMVWRSNEDDRAWSGQTELGVAATSASAPLAEWPAPGDIDPRSPRLRAHGLTRRGIVESPAFGRQLAFASVEGRRWLPTPGFARLGAAVFVDVAQAWRRLSSTTGPILVDAGVGLRIKWPGKDAVLRLDVARGLRDRTHALSVGWQP